MKGILTGIPHVSVYIDNILVTGLTEAEHMQTLHRVLTQLNAVDVRLRRDKCAFMLKQVDYLGYSITMASARIQWWALTLSAYNYHIQYRPGKQLAIADLSSRLPPPDTITNPPLPGETIHLMEALNTSPFTAAHVKTLTNRDRILSRVKQMILQGWQKVTDTIFCPYLQRSKELTLQNDCMLWGCWVVTPDVGRKRVMECYMKVTLA